MSASRTDRTARASASWADPRGREIRLYVPTRWAELSQAQLRYILTLLAEGYEGATLKTYMLVRFAGIEVLGRTRSGWSCAVKAGRRRELFCLQRWQVVSFLDRLKFVDSLEDMDVRLDGVQGLHAVDALLHGVPFGDYLKMELAYQGYIMSQQEQPLRNLARLLYRDGEGRTVGGTPYDKAELLGCHLWFAHVKQVLAREFPDFFRPAPQGASMDEYDALDSYNAQLRILTDGDVTREETVKAVDTWRALTELCARAREAREMQARLNKSR